MLVRFSDTSVAPLAGMTDTSCGGDITSGSSGFVLQETSMSIIGKKNFNSDFTVGSVKLKQKRVFRLSSVDY
jgi:hypothetical protein